MTDPDLLRRLDECEHAMRALEPDAAQRVALREPVLEATENFLEALPTHPAFVDLQTCPVLDPAIPENGAPIKDVVAEFQRAVALPGSHPASGHHMGYVPGGGVYLAALGDYLAAVTNKHPGVFYSGPGAVRMEHALVRWMAGLVGYPDGALGNLASGGSVATLAAVATARDAHQLKGADFARTVVYLTSQLHHCLEKALRLAGLGECVVRRIPMDADWRMLLPALEEQIAADRAAGLRPWLLVGSAGTTDTGAVDPLERLAEVAQRENLWFHVDAAYGGFFLLTGHGRAALRGIERSDSVVLDPHKGLFLPFGMGVVLVRHGEAMRSTHRYFGNYLSEAARSEEVSPADVSPELSRHFRAVRLWLALKVAGVGAFRAALEEKLLLARYAHGRLAELGFEVGREPQLSIVTYRWVPSAGLPDEPDARLAAMNACNERLVEAVRKDGRIFLSSTKLDGLVTLRLAILNFRTHRRMVDLALEVLAAKVERAGEL